MGRDILLYVHFEPAQSYCAGPAFLVSTFTLLSHFSFQRTDKSLIVLYYQKSAMVAEAS